jgi:hypothetical protein
MFNTYIIIKIHLSTVNCVPLDPPGVITLELIRPTDGTTAVGVTTVEMPIGAVTNGDVNELFVVDNAEVCMILVDEAVFDEDVVAIGIGV